jgi:hypothetical protein
MGCHPRGTGPTPAVRSASTPRESVEPRLVRIPARADHVDRSVGSDAQGLGLRGIARVRPPRSGPPHPPVEGEPAEPPVSDVSAPILDPPTGREGQHHELVPSRRDPDTVVPVAPMMVPQHTGPDLGAVRRELLDQNLDIGGLSDVRARARLDPSSEVHGPLRADRDVAHTVAVAARRPGPCTSWCQSRSPRKCSAHEPLVVGLQQHPNPYPPITTIPAPTATRSPVARRSRQPGSYGARAVDRQTCTGRRTGAALSPRRRPAGEVHRPVGTGGHIEPVVHAPAGLHGASSGACPGVRRRQGSPRRVIRRVPGPRGGVHVPLTVDRDAVDPIREPAPPIVLGGRRGGREHQTDGRHQNDGCARDGYPAALTLSSSRYRRGHPYRGPTGPWRGRSP